MHGIVILYCHRTHLSISMKTFMGVVSPAGADLEQRFWGTGTKCWWGQNSNCKAMHGPALRTLTIIVGF